MAVSSVDEDAAAGASPPPPHGAPDGRAFHVGVAEPDAVREPEAPSVGPSIGAVVRLSLGADVARLVANDPVARIGLDTEGVHQARVATRRLRSDLATYAGVLREGRVARLAKDLRWLGRALGTARDLDVLRERVARAVRAIDPLARDDGLVLLARVDEERRATAASLQRVLATDRYARLLTSLAAAVASPPFRGGASRPAAPYLRAALEARYRALAEGVAGLPPTPLDPELHAVRILAKPARYAAEASGVVLGAPCTRFAKRVTELCDVLGTLNDGSRVSLWLDGVATERGRASAVARVRAVEIGRMADARAEWPRSWEKTRAAAAELGWEAAVPSSS